MKKVLSVFLATVLLVFSVPVNLFAAETNWLFPTKAEYMAKMWITQLFHSKHCAIDISSPASEYGNIPIYASKSGKVVARFDGCTCRSEGRGACSDNKRELGNYVIIDHGNGEYSRYCHLHNRNVVALYSSVKQGDIIGYMGSTGSSTGIHLDFRIYTGASGIQTYSNKYGAYEQKVIGGSILNNTPQNVYSYGNIMYITSTQPEIHTHDFSYSNDSAHPHSQYKYCSCGAKEYTGGYNTVSSCKQCYPLGSISFTRSFEKVRGTATFNRNSVANANLFSLNLEKDGYIYGTYNMSSTTLTLNNLPSGTYTATLAVTNTNTYEVRTVSCQAFTILDSYKVSYDPNGGTNPPVAQTKIQDDDLRLSAFAPSYEGYIFKGWATSKTATEAKYQPNDIYTKNAKATLYAVWEPEVYTISFDMNGGKGVVQDTLLTYGNTMKMPNSIIKDEAYLKGWSANQNATTAEYKLNFDYTFKESTKLYAVWGMSTWDSTVASSFAGGDGSEANPFRISSSAELALLASKVNSATSEPEYKHYILTDNINLGYTYEWVPIGLYENPNQYFYGSFDGNGFTISDIYVSSAGEGYIGLFGKAINSEFKNLTVAGTIENINSGETKTYIGGMVANSENTNITNCQSTYFSLSTLNVGTGDYSCAGTLVGGAAGGSIKDCSAKDSSINLSSGNFEAGALVGYSSADITNCFVTAGEAGLFSTASTVGSYRLGGLAGNLCAEAKKCSVNAPYLVNEVQTTGDTRIGGLAGQLDGSAEICSTKFDNGKVKSIDGASYSSSIYSNGTGEISVGGIAGYATEKSRISDCKYDGQSISARSTNTGAAVGGLVGYANARVNPTILVRGDEFVSKNDLPKKNGYKATWYTDSSFTTPFDFTQKLTSDITLFAKWEKGDDSIHIWDGTSKEPSYNASTKTYTITTGEELAWISDVTNGVITSGTSFPTDITFSGYTIELANDIYLNDTTGWENWSETNAPKNNWKPIGKSSEKSFKGWFYGNGFTIQGIYVNSKANYTGLFGYIARNSKVYNTTVENGFIVSSARSTGGISGLADNADIINCRNKIRVESADSFTGGIIGYAISSSIARCINSNTINGYEVVGGIVGNSSKSTITYCYNLSSRIDSSSKAGGIVGKMAQNEVHSCYNTAAIYSNSSVEGGAGGIIGELKDGRVYNCYNLGNVNVEYTGVGGIVGYIRNSTCSGCYSTGNIWSRTDAEKMYGGGIIGVAENPEEAFVEYSFSCYDPVLGRLSPPSNLGYVQYKSKAQLKSLSNLTWFSTDIWATNSSINNGYPYLKALADSYKTYTVTTVADTDNTIARSFANVDGIIYADAGTSGYAGGVIGRGNAPSGAASSITNGLLSVAEKIDASGANKFFGPIIGSNYNSLFAINSAYYNSDVEMTNETNTEGTARSISLIKKNSFFIGLLGLNAYTSIENLADDETAVWVFDDGELPELYYNVLRDITVSQSIENGSMTIDKPQAVDGEVVTVTATPSEGYVLNKVYVNGTEIVGTTFEVSGDSEVYATFAPETKSFTVTVEANENVSAGLENADEVSEVMLMSLPSEGEQELVAKDGEEIIVNTLTDEDYAVEAIYVNGEEVTGTSFIVTANSIVSIEAENISTEISAVTDDAENVQYYFAELSGSVSGDEYSTRYIRLWKEGEPENVYVTEVEQGGGEYSTYVDTLMPETKYYYQMTEYGEVKSFTTPAAPQYTDGEQEEVTPVTTDTDCTRLASAYEFSITADRAITTEDVYVAMYDETGKLLQLKAAEFNGGTEATVRLPITAEAEYTRIFVWADRMRPIGIAEVINIPE